MIPFNHLGWFFNLCSSSAYPRAVVEELCDALKGLPERATLLDLGAGTGTLSRYARGCRGDLEFVAADPAGGMLKYVPEGIGTIRARAEALPFGDASFDAVLIGEALHHFSDPREAAGEIARVLRGGGLLFIYEFDPSTLAGKLICLAEKLFGEPGHFYPPERLKTLLEAHGFSVLIGRHRWRYTLLARTA